MARIRVLVVDDAVTARKIVTAALAADQEIEVVGTAPNGRIALAKVAQLAPDLVTLDVIMPEMDGLQTLAELRRRDAKLPIIMFSSLTERGAEATLDALSLGATDYVAKPAGQRDIDETIDRIRCELVPKIRAICGRSTSAQRAVLSAKPRSAWTAQPGIVAIGVSTGGPQALAKILPNVPANFPLPLLIVQHMPSTFTRLLAARLDQLSAIRVSEAVAGAVLRPGEAWIAPGDFHLLIEGSTSDVRMVLNQDEPENSCRPSVDVLFRSVVGVFGAGTLAVVLTGMGRDGLRGSEAVREAGGAVWVQDRDSSVIWGMPGAVVGAGVADEIVPLDRLVPRLLDCLDRGPHQADPLAEVRE